MISKVEEPRVRGEEREMDYHHPSQSVADKAKTSLVEDKIEGGLVSPLTHNSGTNRKVTSDEDEGEREDSYFNHSSDVLPPINPFQPKSAPSPTIDSASSLSIEISSALDYDSYLNKTESQSLSELIEEMGRGSTIAGYKADDSSINEWGMVGGEGEPNAVR